MKAERVGVIVPAFNAEATIGATLASVRAQTHENLEIVVVDDGSNDGCAGVAATYAQHDRRIRVVRQHNQGVAAARNAGARATDAPLIAFIDADDVWQPTKIEKQVKAISASPRIGLVYTWFASIDESGRAYKTWNQALVSGPALQHLCAFNFIGNGSSVLVTREAFDKCGGFDPSLRNHGAQGCEDWKFYLAVAENYSFAVVPEFLVGYRRRQGAMSSDGLRMLKSFDLVADHFRQRHPQYAADLDHHRSSMAFYLAMREASEGRLQIALSLLPRKPHQRMSSLSFAKATGRFLIARLAHNPVARFVAQAFVWRPPFILSSTNAPSTSRSEGATKQDFPG